MKNMLMENGLYDDYAKQQLKEYIKTQENMAYSTDPKVAADPNFKGTIIENEKIFSKEYEDNLQKEKGRDNRYEGG